MVWGRPGGFHTVWFKLGTDYKNVNDVAHAKDPFNYGVKYGAKSYIYRMRTIAHLMRQLGLPVNPQTVIPLLYRAATLVSLKVPQLACTCTLFYSQNIPGHIFVPSIPAGSWLELEA